MCMFRCVYSVSWSENELLTYILVPDWTFDSTYIIASSLTYVELQEGTMEAKFWKKCIFSIFINGEKNQSHYSM